MTKEAKQSKFKCLRCGYEYTGLYSKTVERTCPQCQSNSVRRLRGKAS
jgi:Zn finger protein HypA/HybF involved in hydrogenase expression